MTGDSPSDAALVVPDLPVKCVRCETAGFTANLIGGDGDVRGMTLHNVTLGGACR